MRFFSPFFWICTLLFTANQGIEKLHIHIPYVHAYLDDLLTAGIVLGFALFVQQQFTYKNKDYTFSVWHSVVFVVWYALLFEVLFPSYDARHHADALDVVAYAIGALGFHYFGNKPVARKLELNSLVKKFVE